MNKPKFQCSDVVNLSLTGTIVAIRKSALVAGYVYDIDMGAKEILGVPEACLVVAVTPETVS